jgi:hypothetical protein
MTHTGRTTGRLTETCTLTMTHKPDVLPGAELTTIGADRGDGLWIVDRIDGCTIHCRRPRWHERALYHVRSAWYRVRGLRYKAHRTALTVQTLALERLPFLSPRFVTPPAERQERPARSQRSTAAPRASR